ncbi:CotD family spore coat protein [Terrilactibacillus laevilacticus]|uniref:CotD family spore coat protein n=1 Tax=Terrilactibacillus laevilacticus TaxID=1380157 RepID=UPI001146608D|nr:CotD family spore coat protein [Terrilactibacillus laevilacticus]
MTWNRNSFSNANPNPMPMQMPASNPSYIKPPMKPGMKNWPNQEPLGPLQMHGKNPHGKPMCHHSRPLHCPPTQAPDIVDPRSVDVAHVYKPVIVKHIHPSHTQIQTHYIYEHQHYYPHSVSHCCDVQHKSIQCGCPWRPNITC